MGIFDKLYLKQSQLTGFDTYKYSCIDNSPLSVYISHPFWNWFVNFYPMWVAPNVLTLAGSLIMMICYTVVSILDYDLTANNYGSYTSKNLPEWLWLFCSICTFVAHLLDGTDGKQARRTGASGPMGELFDHGLDSFATIPFTIIIFSVFGRGEFSISPIALLGVLITVQIIFITTHWEKYNTGILFLPWGYDLSQYGLVVFFLLTSIVGHRYFHFYVYDHWLSFAQVTIIGFYLSAVISVAMSLQNIYSTYFVHRTGKQETLSGCVRPLVSPLLLFAFALCWAVYSPSDLLNRDPRAFFWSMGVVFSNVACRLIIAQMSNTRSQIFNKLVLIYGALVILAVSGNFNNKVNYRIGQHFILLDELFVLRLFAILVTFAHLHFGICVVRQLCDHFKIQAFSLKYLEKQQRKK